MSWSPSIRVLILLVGTSLPLAVAQPDRVEVRVTFVSGDEVFLDRGRDDGVRLGDPVRLVRGGEPGVRVGEVVAAASGSCRARFSSDALPEIGDRGEIETSGQRRSRAPRTDPIHGTNSTHDTDPAPSDDRWADDEIWQGPLLASPEDRRRERAARWRGRFTTFWYEGREESGGRDQRTGSGRSRLFFEGEDLFGRGGRFVFDGQVFQRIRDLEDGIDDRTTRGRLELLSYREGDGSGSPLFWQLGRHRGDGVPELGRHDGAEVQWRPGKGHAWGLQGGALVPRSTDEHTGDALSLVGYYRFQTPGDRPFEWVLAGQQTWHWGERDRRVVFSRGLWRPTSRLDFHALTRVDLYSGARFKSNGPEITELWVQGGYRFSAEHRLRVSYQELRFPERARDDDATARLTADDERQTVRASTQHRVLDQLWLYPRLDYWKDRDDDGVGGELGARLVDVPWPGLELRLAVYRQESGFSTAPGVRASLRQTFDLLAVAIGFDGREDEFDLEAGDVTSRSERIWGELDVFPGGAWTFSTRIERYSGEDQDGFALSGFLQWRF